MKRIFSLLLILLSVGFFVACSNDEINGYNFRSIVDTETNEIFSLGDPATRFESILGEPISILGSSHNFGYLGVIIEEGVATQLIMSETNDGRFEFSTNSDEVRNNFNLSDFDLEGSYYYYRFYDKNDNSVTSADESAYQLGVLISKETDEIMSIIIIE